MTNPISVASAVYNLAGDEENRPDFLKSLVLGGVMQEVDSLSQLITNAYLNGPAMKLRSYARWIRNNPEAYSKLGTTEGELDLALRINPNDIAPLLPTSSYEVVDSIIYSRIDSADLEQWVIKYMSEMQPPYEGPYSYTYNETTELVTLTMGEDTETFTPAGYIPEDGFTYLYVSYITEITDPYDNSKSWSDPKYFIYRFYSGLDDFDDLLIKAEKEYSNFLPPIPFRYENQPVGPLDLVKSRKWKIRISENTFTPIILGVEGGPGEADIPCRFLVQTPPEEPEGLYTYEIEAENQEDRHRLSERLSRDDAQYILMNGTTPITTWKSFLEPPEPIEERPTEVQDIYGIAKKALKKAVNVKYDDVQKAILSNANIDNIDYAYVVFGASMNTKENEALKYIYTFFKTLKGDSDYTIAQWKSDWTDAYGDYLLWKLWQENPVGPRPPFVRFPTLPNGDIKIESIRSGISNYKIHIKWNLINEETGSGLLKPDAKTGELWFSTEDKPVNAPADPEIMPPPLVNQVVTLNWQVSKDSWRRISILGLHHVNYIYGNNTKTTRAYDAVNLEDETSDFIIPIHEIIFKETPLISATQLATSCCYLVFHCYEEYKEPWWASDWFRYLVIGTVIVASIVIAVASGGAGLGLVGALTGIGAGSSLTAIILASAANAIVGILLATLITEVSTELFGEKWGPLVGGIIAVIFSMGMSAGGVLEALQTLTRPEGWLPILTATTNGIATVLAESAKELANSTAELLEEMGEKASEIQKLYNETFGSGEINLNLVNSYIDEVTEKPEHFLQRTLLTGSDIVELTLDSIGTFAKDRLTLVY